MRQLARAYRKEDRWFIKTILIIGGFMNEINFDEVIDNVITVLVITGILPMIAAALLIGLAGLILC